MKRKEGEEPETLIKVVIDSWRIKRLRNQTKLQLHSSPAGEESRCPSKLIEAGLARRHWKFYLQIMA